MRNDEVLNALLTTHNIDRGQTREIGEKQEKYFKGKAVTFAVQRLIFFKYPVDLLTFLNLTLNFLTDI